MIIQTISNHVNDNIKIINAYANENNQNICKNDYKINYKNVIMYQWVMVYQLLMKRRVLFY